MTNTHLTIFDTQPDEADKGGERGVLMLTNADFVDAVFPQLPEGGFSPTGSRREACCPAVKAKQAVVQDDLTLAPVPLVWHVPPHNLLAPRVAGCPAKPSLPLMWRKVHL